MTTIEPSDILKAPDHQARGYLFMDIVQLEPNSFFQALR